MSSAGPAGQTRTPRADVELVRASDWWNDKIPHLIAIAAICVAATAPPPGAAIGHLVLFLTSAVSIAAFGHVVNDLADVEDDRRAGKRNRMAAVPTAVQALLVLTCLVVGLVPWIWLPRSTLALALLGTEVALLLAYSLPPLRLKLRSILGVLADAAYAYVVPALLVIAVFGPPPSTSLWWAAAGLSAFGLVSGVRGIVWHQVDDSANDRVSGVTTLVRRIGTIRSLRAIDRVAPIEILLLAVLIVAAGRYASSPAIVVACAAYVPWRLFQAQYLVDPPVVQGNRRTAGVRSTLLGYISFGVTERWLPVVALVVASVRQPLWWIVTVVHLALFTSTLSEIWHSDGRSLRGGLGRLLVAHTVRTTARRVREERLATLRAAPARVEPAPGEDSPRWVFVLCGAAVHTGTMRTAVRYLRERSSLPIWVLTDTSRNEESIECDGIEQIVDVRAPAGYDDHQAAIWLKTSVHRHLPAGTWCYLDTDIIAIAPGVDELFEHRRGPVVFASDLPSLGNTVDHFSVYAMTCTCRADGLERCGHLREQLRSRLGLEVPGDWCHWNGGVFAFGPDAAPVLERWHELAIASFDWPEWHTRDQGALIATVWEQGLVDLPRLPQEYNFIVANPWQVDVRLDADLGWSMRPDGPWLHPRMLHLFQAGLDAPDWDVGLDVERPVLRSTVPPRDLGTGIDRYTMARWWSEHVSQPYWRGRSRVTTAASETYWAARKRYELYRNRARRRVRKLRPARLAAAVRRRLR